MADLCIRIHFNRVNVDQNSGDYSALNTKKLYYNHDNLSIKPKDLEYEQPGPRDRFQKIKNSN
jgi:hypothetical protein